jgi:hypothetical protein
MHPLFKAAAPVSGHAWARSLGRLICACALALVALEAGRSGAGAQALRPQTARLETRLRALEDRQEILNLLAASPFSSEAPSAAFQEGMYTEDAVMDRGAGSQPLVGRKAVVDTVRVPDHLAAVEAGMAHFAGLPHIRIEGDRAVATGYLAIMVPSPDAPKVGLGNYAPASGLMLWRLTANRWELIRTSQGWRMTKRTIRAAPSQPARALLSRAIDTKD